jgi:LysR family nitrogen assimilation transcriptional regulator
MDIKQLIYFRKVLEIGNMTRAADSLGVAQTALGIQIRNLEDELGVPLFDRHSRGVEVTDSGALLGRYAKDIIDRVERARQVVRGIGREEVIPVTLGVTPSVMRLVGDDILIDLHRLIPNISLKVVEELSVVLTRMMERGEVTCAFTYSRDPGVDVKRRALLEEDLFFLTAPEATPNDDPVPFHEVMSHDLAFNSRREAIFSVVEEVAERLNLSINVTYEVQSIRAVKNLVARGIAGAVMPYGAAEGELRSGVLKGRPVVEPTIVRTLLFAYPRDQAALMESPPFRSFVDAVVDRMLAFPGPIMRRL